MHEITSVGVFDVGIRDQINENFKTPVSADAPTSADSPGEPGQIAFDENYLYVCTAANTWARVALQTMQEEKHAKKGKG